MNISILSRTAKRILNSNIGYRNDNIGAGEFLIQDIMKYEIEELENTDIFKTLKTLYGLQFKNIYDIAFWVNKMFNGTNVYGVWLTSKTGVKQWYTYDGTKVIDVYELPTKKLILSDLGDEGVLFAIPCSKVFLRHNTVRI